MSSLAFHRERSLSLSLAESPGTPLKPVLQNRHLLSIADLSPLDLKALLSQSHILKAAFSKSNPSATFKPLVSRSVAMIFQKRSTRTRVSVETGSSLLGGHALFLGPSDIQLGVNECIKDTSKVLSRFNDIILARVYKHQDVVDLAQYGGVGPNRKAGEDPQDGACIINALSDKHHPLQALADVMTLQQHFGTADLRGKTVGWVGDGNNVCHDLMLASAKCGMLLQVATPVGYECDASVVAEVRRIYREESEVDEASGLLLTTVAADAAKGADVIFTDTWVSMGEEAMYEQKVKAFAGYQVTEELMQLGNEGAVFMHCLPRHEEEVDDDVFYGKRSLVWEEAENRMWTVMAVMMSQLGKTITLADVPNPK